MKYASTILKDDRETVVVVLPLGDVPGFDTENPHPWTYSVPDEVEVGWVKDGDNFVPPPPPTPEQLTAIYSNAIQKRMDAFAKERGYDNIHTAASYKDSSIPSFKTEGEHCAQLRDMTWAKCYQIMGEVLAGLRQVPTFEELLAELPPMEWPV